MNCNQYQELIALYIEGDLLKKDILPVEAHLKTCTACREFADRLRGNQTTLKALSEDPGNDLVYKQIRKRVLGRINDQIGESKPRWAMSWRFALRVGVPLFILLCLGIFVNGFFIANKDIAVPAQSTPPRLYHAMPSQQPQLAPQASSGTNQALSKSQIETLKSIGYVGGGDVGTSAGTGGESYDVNYSYSTGATVQPSDELLIVAENEEVNGLLTSQIQPPTTPPAGKGELSSVTTSNSLTPASQIAPNYPSSTYSTIKEGDLVELGPDVVKPEVIRRVNPYYPPLAASKRIEGTVILSILISENGDVQDVKVLRTGGEGFGLNDSAVAAVRQWKFRPALADGKRVKVWMTYPIVFKLDSGIRYSQTPPKPTPESQIIPKPTPVAIPFPTQGALRAQNRAGEVVGEFPLKHTEVTADISGYLARTVVQQEYTNPYREPIEAVYVFPLPTMAAVNDFVMEIGDHKIIGIIRPREEAERIYREARAKGQTASLLTQERPNIFTQNVANIEPGGKVTIKITYFEKLVYERGYYEYVFPMVVGPRYIPGNPQPIVQGKENGGGWSPATNQVPDADKITPPVMKPGERSGNDINLTVHLDAALPIRDLTSVTHKVVIENKGPWQRFINLAKAKAIPNRDFVLRWSVAGDATQFGVLAHRGDQGGFFTLMMQPPLDPADNQVSPREITFILDVSGSMSGLPLDMSKEIVTRTLDRMRPEDIFNIFIFAGGNGQLWETPQPNTPANIATAKQFLQSLQGSGGTEMLAGVQRALHAAHDPKYLQMYSFLTDGYVGNEDQILRLIKEERAEARFFAFGIGSSVNRYLIEGIGTHGGGVSHIVIPRDRDHAERAVQRFFECIDSPVLVDLSINWNGLPVREVYPKQIPDLFAGQTINVIGRFERAAKGSAIVKARVGARQVQFDVPLDLPEQKGANAALAPVWARNKIAELSGQLLTAQSDEQTQLVQQITDLAVKHRLVSQYTAFVAVDESRIVGNGKPLRVLQPVEMPEGVSYEGVFGEKPVGQVMVIPGWGMTVQMTASGKIRVAQLNERKVALRSGVKPAAVLISINRTLIYDMQHLEGLLLQTSGDKVEVGFEPGGSIVLPAP